MATCLHERLESSALKQQSASQQSAQLIVGGPLTLCICYRYLIQNIFHFIHLMSCISLSAGQQIRTQNGDTLSVWSV